jgi:hypothetical protein
MKLPPIETLHALQNAVQAVTPAGHSAAVVVYDSSRRARITAEPVTVIAMKPAGETPDLKTLISGLMQGAAQSMAHDDLATHAGVMKRAGTLAAAITMQLGSELARAGKEQCCVPALIISGAAEMLAKIACPVKTADYLDALARAMRAGDPDDPSNEDVQGAYMAAETLARAKIDRERGRPSAGTAPDLDGIRPEGNA